MPPDLVVQTQSPEKEREMLPLSRVQLENALLESRCTKGRHTGLREKVSTLDPVRR